MSTAPDKHDNILLCYEMIPEEVSFYFIPAESDLPLPLLHAIARLEGVYVNHVDKSPDSVRAEKDVAYLQAALCTGREYLDEKNPYQENRFFGLLVPYKIERGSFSFQPLGVTHLIRTGFYM